MAYTRQQAQQVYNAKMRALMLKNARVKQEQDDADRLAWEKKQQNEGKLSLFLQGLNIGQTQGEKVQAKLMQDVYYEGGIAKPKYKFKPPTKLLDIPEKAKRFVDPESALELRPEYIEYGESLEVPKVIDMEDDFYVPGQDVDPLSWEADEVIPDVPPVEALDYKPTDTMRIKDVGDPMGEDFDPTGGIEKGIPDYVPMASGGDPITSGEVLPDVDVAPDVEIPDAKPDGKFVGKTLGALKTGQDMLNIGKVLTDEDASGEDKAIAGTQAAKMLADLAAKKAGQETASQIGGKAATQFIKGKGLQEGVKLGGKQAVGAVAGGVIGGYTAITEAKEAGEAWKEKDYDEAILHGMGSASGGLQTAGAGMMLSGVGAPLGAVLYGIGTAGSVISGVGLMLEDLFGGGDAPAEVQKPKFDYGRYFESIRRR